MNKKLGEKRAFLPAFFGIISREMIPARKPEIAWNNGLIKVKW